MGKASLAVPLLGAAAFSIWLLGSLPWKKRKQDRHPGNSCDAEQQTQALRSTYQAMSADFQEKGLDMNAIESMKPWYHGLDAPDQMPWPKLYSQVSPPMPSDAVRLLVLPYEECPTLAAAAAAAAADIAKLLSSGVPDIKIFLNARPILHCTIFHTSHPLDLRPAVTHATQSEAASIPAHQSSGGGGGVATDQQQHQPLRTATDFELQRELDLVARCVAQAQPPRLKFERLVMAPSGVLLMTWTDPDGRVPALRSHLQETFPNASARQAKIIHSSLLRVVKSPQLPPLMIQAIQEKCDEWTKKLAGKVLTGSSMWWVREHEFSTVTGERFALKLGTNGNTEKS